MIASTLLRAGVLVAGVTAAMLMLRDTVPVFGEKAPRVDVQPAPLRAQTRMIDTGQEMIIPAGSHGHHFVDAEINGATVPFIVDTGASVVALSPDILPSLGIGLHQRNSMVNHGQGLQPEKIEFDEPDLFQVGHTILCNDLVVAGLIERHVLH